MKLMTLPKQINETKIKKYSFQFFFVSMRRHIPKNIKLRTVVTVPTFIPETADKATLIELKLLTPIAALIVRLIPKAANI